MIIDIHTHLTPPEIIENRAKYLSGEADFGALYTDPKSPMVGPEELVAAMDEAGVDKAVVTGLTWKSEETAKRHNYWLLEVGEKYKGRLYPMAAFNPTTPWAVKHSEELLKAGAFGLGELGVYTCGFDCGCLENFKGIAALMQEYDKPLMVHVNEPIGHAYPGKAPLEMTDIYELVKICQGVKLILAHLGGGLPFFATLKKEVDEYLENVWYDTAAMPYLYKLKAYRLAIEAVGAEKILMGTDFPLLKPGRYYKDFEKAGLSDAEIELIKGRAAQNAFNF